MRKALVVFTRDHPEVSWKEVDIDRDIELIRQYDSTVPVLCYENTEICHYFFDESALIAVIALA
jgi:hypothetical protein